MENDTIVAISTPNTGEGGIGIIRLSGKGSLSLADKIFTSGKNTGKPSQFETHTINYGWITDGKTKIDEVLLSVMKAPKTYTREDIVEISAHGGPAVLRKILELCLASGARMAGPGEFTKRAFLNGRIDLSQAEAVSELIRAKTDKSARFAVEQVTGGLSQKIKGLRSQLISLIANFEVELDHSEEDIKFASGEETEKTLNNILKDIGNIITASQKNRVYVEGVKIAIAGKPNVGKSSLFNAVLEKERAIVTALPGTTRDIVAETFNLQGIPVTIMDTAGIMADYLHEGKIEIQRLEQHIEKISTQKARDVLGKTDIVLFVIDVTALLTNDDTKIAELVSKAAVKVIFVLNKTDLVTNTEQKRKEILEKFRPYFDKIYFTECSALKMDGITGLENAIYDKILEEKAYSNAPDTADSEFVVNLRQEEALNKACVNIKSASQTVRKGESGEFTVLSVRSALDNLGEITGETTNEEILDIIFSKFCVGK
ncbi:MAG: tRNA uridine-5-carboxymethylaminomethyl(34) synthesis GTPase MnmE [Elusimicrobia bacterium]|nr:tRNA uridine-5-carboxymethylaminomethyl(34) synthesis GTPase MnmE [Elusimicrobiota bacterium]MBU2614909.1 tRNA uridine-5-carboxymethylaminomethyl(34) synthesis GTPase MnmE [Elusimicrobiota bacterium]